VENCNPHEILLFLRDKATDRGLCKALDAWRKCLQDHGVTFEKEVEWPRGGKFLYFRDPAGNSVELLTPGVWGLPSGW
jgi:catechol 2,3-dioxygenase-like lactoylglutathione lyase family enzyme